MAIIYMLTNNRDDKVVVCYTRHDNLERVASTELHYYQKRMKCYVKHLFYDEYGFENCSIVELEVVADPDINDRKAYWLTRYDNYMPSKKPQRQPRTRVTKREVIDEVRTLQQSLIETQDRIDKLLKKLK